MTSPTPITRRARSNAPLRGDPRRGSEEEAVARDGAVDRRGSDALLMGVLPAVRNGEQATLRALWSKRTMSRPRCTVAHGLTARRSRSA